LHFSTTRRSTRSFTSTSDEESSRDRSERTASSSSAPGSSRRSGRRPNLDESSHAGRTTRLTRSQTSISTSTLATIAPSLSTTTRNSYNHRPTSVSEDNSIRSILRSCNLDLEHLAPVLINLGICTSGHARAFGAMSHENIKDFFDKYHEKLGMSELEQFVFISRCKALE